MSPTLFWVMSLLAVAIGHASTSPLTYLGNKETILPGGVATKDLVFVSGTTPTINGTIPKGIESQTAAVINNIAAILEEAGTSWGYALKTTVYLADMDDFSVMITVYESMLPRPKPARSAIQVAKLPGDFVIEIEATAAIPRC